VLFFAEKELLKELIEIHLEFTKAKKKGFSTSTYRKQFNKIYDELEVKIGEETMEEVEKILTDCEEVI
jgi:hypothetical protein